MLENEAFKSKLTTVMQSGEPPDIFQSWGGGVMNEYATAGLLRDITPELDADGGAWRNTFATGALGVYSYKGKNYGVPWDMGMIGWWYNKDLFAQAGIAKHLPPPGPNSSPMSRLLKPRALPPSPSAQATNGLACTCGPISSPAWAVRPTSKAPCSAPVPSRDAPFVEAGKKLQELIALQPFQDGFLAATYGDEATAMGNGKAAMELMGQWAPVCRTGQQHRQEGHWRQTGLLPLPDG